MLKIICGARGSIAASSTMLHRKLRPGYRVRAGTGWSFHRNGALEHQDRKDLSKMPRAFLDPEDRKRETALVRARPRSSALRAVAREVGRGNGHPLCRHSPRDVLPR